MLVNVLLKTLEMNVEHVVKLSREEVVWGCIQKSKEKVNFKQKAKAAVGFKKLSVP